jgi:hypothetical protein
MRPPSKTPSIAAAVAVLLAGAPRGASAATPTAQYTVTFDATWSQATHPFQFPPGAHWSPLVGGTHSASVSFWGPGQLASQGIEDMAELGATAPLSNEVGAAITAGTAASVILGGGISPSPGSTSVSFTIQRDFPLVTLVSMIAPSPDWFVGVTGLPLLENGDWIVEKTVTLWLYDAGTDGGTTYTSPNLDTSPQDPIALHSMLPGYNGVPMGTFTFRRTDLVAVDPRTPTSTVSFARPSRNPAVGSVTLCFSLPRAAHARLTIYDASGRRVRQLASGERPGGDHAITWDMRDDGGRAVGAGLYLARLEADGSSLTHKVATLE